MRRILLVLVALLSLTSLVAADPLYKWVDDQGNIHYSDKPQPGAQKIVLPKASTYVPPNVAMPAAPAATRNQSNSVQAYSNLTISSPKDQETLWNVQTVTVSVSMVPMLQTGDTLTISVDGVSKTSSGSSVTFDNLDRGEHDVTATVSSRNGRGTLTAQSVFYIQKNIDTKPPL